MLLKFLEYIIDHLPFIDEFIIVSNDDKNINLKHNEFEILIKYDESTNNIDINFDVSHYLNSANHNYILAGPAILNVNKIAQYLDINLLELDQNNLPDSYTIVSTLYTQLLTICMSLRQLDNSENKHYRIRFIKNMAALKMSDFRIFDEENIKLQEQCKLTRYKRDIKLVLAHKYKLGNYDLNRLYYSMNSNNF